MKCFMILLAIGLASSEKLGLGYLPPPGAIYSGGNAEDIQIPFEPPGFISSGQQIIPVIQNGQPNYGNKEVTQISGTSGPSNYIPQNVPTTTTSYAFAQTTTYPENYETTVTPINPITGLPINFDGAQQFIQGQPIQNTQSNVNYNQNVPQDGNGLANFGNQRYEPTRNQPLNQYAGQKDIISGTLDSLNPVPNQGGPAIQGKQSYKYPENKFVNPDNVIQIGGSSTQGPNLASDLGNTINRQQVLIPSTAIPQTTPFNFKPGYQNQESYNGQPISVQELPTQTSYNDLLNNGDSLQQSYGGNNISPTSEIGTYKPGNNLSPEYNTYPSSTPLPNIPSSTSKYFPRGPFKRPERPQAESDRNAVILNYENVRTPNGYAYSFDTSNGIHADESGIVDNGTKAQGAYSYIGDDGKVYSVIYTADENGFQPRGDHLPTPPPIPEAIQKVIEQAAIDKAAGIVDDGTYDENKYGHKNYQGKMGNRKQGMIKNKNGVPEIISNRKPVTGLYANDDTQDLNHSFNDNGSNGDKIIKPSVTISQNKPSDKTVENIYHDKKGSIISPGIDQGYQFDGVNDNDKPDNNNFYKSVTEGSLNQQTIQGNNPFDNSGLYKDIVTVKPDSRLSNNFNKPTKDEKIFDVNNNDNPDNFNYNQANENQAASKQVPNSVYGERIRDRPDISTLNQSTKKPLSNQQFTSQYDDGYYYKNPNIQFNENQFPNRFRPQEPSSANNKYDSKDIGMTRRPFITPNIYDEDRKINKGNDESLNSVPRKPFITPGVTPSTKNDYNDYDDGDDDKTGQGNYYGDIKSTSSPDRRYPTTASPHSTSTSRPQFTTSGQKIHPSQKELISSGPRIDNYETISPGYSLKSTSPVPYNDVSSYKPTEPTSVKIPSRQQQTVTFTPTVMPSTSTTAGIPISSTSPIASQTYRYKITEPSTQSFGTRVTPGYTSSPGFIQSPGGAASKNYSAYLPGYTTTTNSPPISSGISGTASTSPLSYQNQYQYGPGKNQYGTSLSPDFQQRGTVSTSRTPGIYQPTVTGNQNIYQHGPGGFSSTIRPSTPYGYQPQNNRQSTTYQKNYEVQSTTPRFPSTSVPGIYRGVQSTNSPLIQNTYGPSQPFFSGTESPSTIGTTPGYTPTGQPVSPSQIYSTQQPVFSSTPNSYGNTPVDGFGRPIVSGIPVTSPNEGSKRPIFGTRLTNPPSINTAETLGPNYTSSEAPTGYPGTYSEPKIKGEDFSGPQQPQRYDPETGYHY